MPTQRPRPNTQRDLRTPFAKGMHQGAHIIVAFEDPLPARLKRRRSLRQKGQSDPKHLFPPKNKAFSRSFLIPSSPPNQVRPIASIAAPRR